MAMLCLEYEETLNMQILVHAYCSKLV